MVGRLREFLTQIEQNFPVIPPAANAENNEENFDENFDEFDWIILVAIKSGINDR